MHNKHKLTFGVLVIIALFVLAVRFDFAGATYVSPATSSKLSSIPGADGKKTVQVKKTKQKQSSKVSKASKPQGAWRVVAIYNGPGPDGPFIPNTVLNTGDALELTFKADGYCRSDYADPVDDSKPFCEPLTFKKDGTFTGSRLEAFGGFMRLNGARLEFLEGGMGGYTKYVLEKNK